MSRRAALRDMLGAISGPALAGMARAAEGPTKLKEGGGEIEVSFESDGFDLPRTALLEWVRTAARAVSAYLRALPRAPRARADFRGRRTGRFARHQFRRRRRAVPHHGGPPYDRSGSA